MGGKIANLANLANLTLFGGCHPSIFTSPHISLLLVILYSISCILFYCYSIKGKRIHSYFRDIGVRNFFLKIWTAYNLTLDNHLSSFRLCRENNQTTWEAYSVKGDRVICRKGRKSALPIPLLRWHPRDSRHPRHRNPLNFHDFFKNLHFPDFSRKIGPWKSEISTI